jgi:phosphatidylglycerophosphate synthase
MRYVADMLTFLRLLLAFIVPGLVLDRNWMFALILFGIAALSDALDGWCARQWPYTPEEEARLPWRRIDHHALDNGPDALMVLLTVVALVSSIHYWLTLALVIYGVGALFFVTVLVLIRRGAARAAEIVDVVFGYWFVINIGMVATELARRAGVVMPTVLVGSALLLVILRFKWERAVSRPETREAAMKYAK